TRTSRRRRRGRSRRLPSRETNQLLNEILHDLGKRDEVRAAGAADQLREPLLVALDDNGLEERADRRDRQLPVRLERRTHVEEHTCSEVGHAGELLAVDVEGDRLTPGGGERTVTAGHRRASGSESARYLFGRVPGWCT